MENNSYFSILKHELILKHTHKSDWKATILTMPVDMYTKQQKTWLHRDFFSTGQTAVINYINVAHEIFVRHKGDFVSNIWWTTFPPGSMSLLNKNFVCP